VRFHVRTLTPGAERGNNEGLTLEVVEGSGGKRLTEYVLAALAGKAKVVHKGSAASFALPEEAAKKLAANDGCTAIIRGVLTVPETGVYRFRVAGSSAGLYLEDGKGGLVKLIENPAGDIALEASVPLGKGSHRVLGVARWPQGGEPFQVLLRNGEGAFKPLPVGMLSH
jgi:hypothetical protein